MTKNTISTFINQGYPLYVLFILCVLPDLVRLHDDDGQGVADQADHDDAGSDADIDNQQEAQIGRKHIHARDVTDQHAGGLSEIIPKIFTNYSIQRKETVNQR